MIATIATVLVTYTSFKLSQMLVKGKKLKNKKLSTKMAREQMRFQQLKNVQRFGFMIVSWECTP